MEYINGSDFNLSDTAVTFGKFDGLHLGHKELIEETVSIPKLKKVLFTFDSNPFENDMKVIYTAEEKRRLTEESGLDYMINFPFTKEIINMKAEEFIEKIVCRKLNAKKLVVGTDFRFGKGRMGDIGVLADNSVRFGYELKVIEKKKMYGEEISSTRIRELIKNGNIELANELLGRAFSYSGEIIHGNHLGHTVGMPTINIKPDTSKLIPPFGVYASYTELDGMKYRGITNIGVKPTVSENNGTGIETWLFGFDKDVYGHYAKVNLLGFIRKEMKFGSLEAVKKQVNIDRLKAMEFDGICF